ncbi:MAG: hypothetical protein LBC64_01955 [Fibromonadaceae bacterium]|jgi:predicted DNA-binding transcriptional regulator YafY|nr:hypothetical protein [Fibromonadaceae bacterium]
MKDKTEIFREAISTGQVIKIKYFGGSQPGTVREVVPRKIDDNKNMLYAYFEAADRIIGFSLSKTEIASESDAVSYIVEEKSKDAKSQLNLKELIEKHRKEFEKLGWFVNIVNNSIELFESENEKETSAADVCIAYETDKKNPWILKTTTSFKNEKAIEKFWKS